MKINHNYQKRVDKVRELMKAEGIDVFLGTRGKSDYLSCRGVCAMVKRRDHG